MKLLLDENLSRRIVTVLQEAFPGTTHVALVGLERASDREVWEYARSGGYNIVSKDEDYLGLISLRGYPPKLVLLTLGNCTNQQIVDALVGSRAEIDAALERVDVGFVEVWY